MDNTLALNTPAVSKKPPSGNTVYGKYGPNNGVPAYLLGLFMAKELLVVSALMIKFNDVLTKLNDSLSKTSDELKKIMQSKLLYTQLTSAFSIAVIFVAILGVGAMLVNPVENPETIAQKFQSTFTQIAPKADMILTIFTNIPISVFSYFNGIYQAKSTQEDKKIDVIKAAIDTIYTSYDGDSKTSEALMQGIQEMIKGEYNSSTLPLYYTNLQ